VNRKLSAEEMEHLLTSSLEAALMKKACNGRGPVMKMAFNEEGL